MNNISVQKNQLIEFISAINDPELLAFLERRLKEWQGDYTIQPTEAGLKDNTARLSVRSQLLQKPMREKLDTGNIKIAQKWKGEHEKTTILQLFKDLEISDSLPVLLSQLSR